MAAHELSELLSDAEVKAVLQRAAEIERTGGALSVGELERAAVEAGIDSAALMKAVSEVLARRSGAAVAAPAEPQAKQPWYKRMAGRIGTVLTAVTGLWTGVAVGFVGGDGWAILAMWLLLASSLLLAGSYRRGGSRAEMHARLLALWGSFIVGFSMIEGEVEEATIIVMGLWLASAAAASMMTWKSPRRDGAPAPNMQPTPAGTDESTTH
jgi:hypothetical protein